MARFCLNCATALPSQENVAITETMEAPKEELTTGSIFGDRYQIIEELGKGGMGRVYKALDTKINEKIALKLIKPEIASDKNTITRFGNELKMARKISHRNVGTMYHIGEEKGTHFITMEYIPGENLKSMIRMSGQLGLGTAIRIAKHVCEGLIEAHRMGVIHRDLKPGNIMIDRQGDARILDFGIARSLGAKGITGAGVMIGTPEYMSPEQVEGKEADQRSDIYSLGIILYEMMTGRVPFEADTPFAIGVMQKGESPQDPKELNPNIPDTLSEVILKCLEKQKENRYQSVEALQSELGKIETGIPTTERVASKRKPMTSKEVTVTFSPKKVLIPALIIVALVIIAVAIWQLLPSKESAPPPPEKHSIAVLPFEDLSPQKDQEHFCDGLADELINRLNKVESLIVPARSSSFYFKGKDISPQEIGEKLKVSNILEGTLRKSGNRLRITVSLINASDGFPIWSDQYQRDEEDIFDLQDKISLDIVDNLKVKLLGEEKAQLVRRNTQDPEAYNLYLRGRFFWNKRTEEGIKKAIDYFEQAIAKDPDYALAYVGLADSYNIIPWYSSFPFKQAIQKAREAVMKSLAIDNSNPEALATSGFNKMYDFDWSGAESELKKAIELNPNYATAHHWLAFYYLYQANFERAIEEILKARELDPLSVIINADIAQISNYAREYDLAIDGAQKAIELDPNWGDAYFFLGYAYYGKSMIEETLSIYKKSSDLDPRNMAYVAISAGSMFDQIGQSERAQQVRDEFIRGASRPDFPPFLWAVFYFSIGENNRGFEWLDKAYEERDPFLWYVKVDHNLDDVRSDPRYLELLSKVGLD
jgi:serine/threonine protein kinase/Tfp pilus assembly protein PilF